MIVRQSKHLPVTLCLSTSTCSVYLYVKMNKKDHVTCVHQGSGVTLSTPVIHSTFSYHRFTLENWLPVIINQQIWITIKYF